MILITNDDGIQAPGILALKQALVEIDRVVVVAPDRERSSIGMAITLNNPLRLKQISNDVYAVDGTPVDCVDLALAEILSRPPKLIISGINRGENLGHDVHFSGTLAAARKGVLLNIPSLAISQTAWRGPLPHQTVNKPVRLAIPETLEGYQSSAQIASQLVKKVLVDGIPDNVLLNVNVPNSDLSEIRDMVVTRQDRGLYSAQAIKREDRYERTYYWIGGVRSTDDHEDDTDIHAVQNNRVSITPIIVDLTDYQQTESVKNWLSS